MKFRALYCLLPFCCLSAHGQVPPPVYEEQSVERVVTEEAKSVLVDGKPVEEMTDDELIDFLQSKVQSTDQADGELRLLRLAPGYALTLQFNEPVQSVIVGDPSIASYEKAGKVLVLSAKTREGDTNMKVVFTGDTMLEYHLFIAPDFAQANSTLKIAVFRPKNAPSALGSPGGSSFVTAGEPNFRAISHVVWNYDALRSENALDRQSIRRTEEFRRGSHPSFIYYYVYTFRNAGVAVQFSFKNPYGGAMRFDPSKLRIAFGDVIFKPTFVAMNPTQLAAGQAANGYAFFSNPPFKMNQPWELTWGRLGLEKSVQK